MRNLKKSLALVLAMTMALSLMVTVNAANVTADFSDAHAVDVTNGMGILKGYDDGTFKPGKNITRAEMTALVYRLATGDWQDLSNNIHSNYVKFKDVKKDSWYAGYVGCCENAEIIKDINNTNYAAALSYPATRELVAEMIFQAAQRNRVQWTDAFGYQSGDYSDYGSYSVYTPWACCTTA